MYMRIFLPSRSMTSLSKVSPWERWIVLAAAGLSGNWVLRTSAFWLRPTLNCLEIGVMGVHDFLMLPLYKCLFWCLVLTPTSFWSNSTHTTPDAVLLDDCGRANLVDYEIPSLIYFTPYSYVSWHQILPFGSGHSQNQAKISEEKKFRAYFAIVIFQDGCLVAILDVRLGRNSIATYFVPLPTFPASFIRKEKN